MRHLRRSAPLGLCLATLAAANAPAKAQQDVTSSEVTAGDVAMTPLEDINLAQDPIPPILLKARKAPYASDEITTCDTILRELGNLDAVLGEDFDTTAAEERDLSAEKVAQGVVRWLIPFRGVIREVSGASKAEFEFRQAIIAGLVRRAYLKGRGQAQFCPYPARPATPEVLAAIRAARAQAEAPNEPATDTGEEAY